jgi:hypothetical protein
MRPAAAARPDIRRRGRAFLSRLRTDYIDVWRMVHWVGGSRSSALFRTGRCCCTASSEARRRRLRGSCPLGHLAQRRIRRVRREADVYVLADAQPARNMHHDRPSRYVSRRPRPTHNARRRCSSKQYAQSPSHDAAMPSATASPHGSYPPIPVAIGAARRKRLPRIRRSVHDLHLLRAQQRSAEP